MGEAQPEHEVEPILQLLMLVMYQKEGTDLKADWADWTSPRDAQQLQAASSGQTNEQLAIQVHSLPTSKCKVLESRKTGAAIL